MRVHDGFSLAEVLIAVLLMGVMLAVATKPLLSLRRNAHVRGAVDTYVAKHALARATAVRMGRLAQLRADPAGGRLWVEVQGAPVAGSMTYLQDGVRFSTDRTNLCFDARGLATTGGTCQSPAATVVFHHANRSDTVRTTLLGRVIR